MLAGSPTGLNLRSIRISSPSIHGFRFVVDLPDISFRAFDRVKRFPNPRGEVGLSDAAFKCLEARGYNTAPDFAYSADPSMLGALILGLLKHDQSPKGGILGPDLPDACALMHVEAGRLRILHTECKGLASGNEAYSSSGQPTPKPRSHDEHEADVSRKLPGGSTKSRKHTRAPYLGKHFQHAQARESAQLRGLERYHFKRGRRADCGASGVRHPRTEVQTLLNMCFEESIEMNPNDVGGEP